MPTWSFFLFAGAPVGASTAIRPPRVPCRRFSRTIHHRRALPGRRGPGRPAQPTYVRQVPAALGLDDARAVVLVEGISDQRAVEALAYRAGRDLPAERVVVVAMGGATNIGRYLS